MKITKLLPCPFCGGQPKMVDFGDIVCNNKNCLVHPLRVQLMDDGVKLNNATIAWNTRPKPSVKWPDKLKYYYSKKTYPANCVEAANKMLAACQAAVEAAGLEYGLDEKGILNVIINTPKNCDDTLNIDRIAYNLKLAEKELITRTTP